MLLSSPHHSAEKFSHPIASGLRSLLAPPSGGVVVTRAIAAASRGCGGEGGAQESRDGTSGDHGKEKAKAEEEEEEDVTRSSDEEDEGCWVSYGRREPRRRLPPPIPSLQLARGALRRTRTQDGRLVVRVAPVVWRECIRARRRGGRLTMQAVRHDDEDDSPLLTPRSAREGDTRALEEPDDDTSSPPTAIGEGVEEGPAAAREMLLPVVPPPRVASAGCFEDVFKYGSIVGSSLHRMPSLRMVH